MLPWFVLATWVGRRHLAALLVVHGIGGMGLLAFAAQALWVTDHYGLAQEVRWGLVSSLGNILLVLIGVCEVALLLWLVHARRQESLRVRSAVVRVTGWSVALIVALLLVVLFLLSPPLAGREFDGYEFAYAALTDFRSAAAYLGLPLCVFAVVGVARLLAGRGRRDALLIVLMFLPASLLVGTIYDLFITRYLLVSVVPMFVIGLCGWLPPGWPPMGNRFRAAVPVALIAVLCGFQVWSSWSLYAVRDYDGMTRTLKKLARPVLKDNGILLCQYPRLGAPMQRVYGIPTLTLNRDVHKDTTEQLIGWRAVCAAMPERPAFFMTPFELPEWEGVRFELVEEAALRHYKPRGGLFNPPGRRQREANKHFRLYRMMEEE